MAANLSIRNVDEDMIASLERRAARNGRTAEAEIRDILLQAAESEPSESFESLAAKSREMSAGRTHTPAEILQREGRADR